MTAGLISVNDNVNRQPKHVVQAGDRLQADLRQGTFLIIVKHITIVLRDGAGARPFDILHSDDDVVVIDKRHGILSAPTFSGERGAVAELVRKQLKAQGESARYLGVVHRLDAETSGCLVFARTRQAQRILGEQFATHAAERSYRALCLGGPRQDRDTLRGKIGRGYNGKRAVVDENAPGKDAVTHFTVANRYAEGSEAELRLKLAAPTKFACI